MPDFEVISVCGADCEGEVSVIRLLTDCDNVPHELGNGLFVCFSLFRHLFTFVILALVPPLPEADVVKVEIAIITNRNPIQRKPHLNEEIDSHVTNPRKN